MFALDPKWLIPAALLSSDRLLHFDLYSDESKSIYTVLKIAAHDYQSYIGQQLRKEDISLALEEWQDNGAIVSPMACLRKIGEYFLVWQGHCFEVKELLLEEWLTLCSILDPSWIIAAAYKRLLSNQIITVTETVISLNDYQCPIALPKASNYKDYADNHIHLGGHGSASLSMLNFVLYLKQKPKETIEWPRRSEYSIFESNLLEKNYLPLMVSQLGRDLGGMIYGSQKHEFFDFDNIKFKKLKDDLLVDLIREDQQTPAQNLIAASHLSSGSSVNRWLLFCCGVLMNQEKNIAYEPQLNRFIRTSNILRNYMTVSGIGLGQFVEYFGFNSRKVNNDSEKLGFKNHALRYDLTGNISREFRVSPDSIVKKNKDSIHQLTPKSLTNLVKKLAADKKLDNAHFVVHFTRGFPKNSNKNDKYLLGLRESLLSQVRKLQQFSNSVAYSDVELICSEENTKIKNFDLRKMIRGFDVAGNENELPIEVFAPALRVLRSANYKSNGTYSTRLPKPFITVHAGEDYSHLLNGLRAIDEAVEFCQLNKGDRLGHALALGINVENWATRQQRAYLTVGEHLDNLVWCHYQSLQITQFNSDFMAVTSLLEYKINHWAGYLYDSSFKITDFYQAWLLRRNCPKALALEELEDSLHWSDWLPDLSMINTKNTNNAKVLWETYLNSGEPSLNSKRNHVISISCQPSNDNTMGNYTKPLTDSTSIGELRLYDAIQDLMMEKYSKNGIVIEACPTSNLYIGRFKKYHEHPIFRWNPPNLDWLKSGEKFNRYGLRRGAIPVCVNTDDSALMPTTIANEHRILKETAINYYEVGACLAEEWIDRIRQKGVDVFLDNHLRQ